MLRNILKKNAYLKALYQVWQKKQLISLEYHVDFKPRWGLEGHPALRKIIESKSETIQNNLQEMNALAPLVEKMQRGDFPFKIKFEGGFLPFIDGLSLAWAAKNTKGKFVEIGSGKSTLYVKASLMHHSQDRVQLISIDPAPRGEIDEACNQVIRERIEDIDLSLFDNLQAGDTVFIDNSHRSFMNSDVTIVMLDILPRLKKGVLVGFHDIMLPYDYPEKWTELAFNEQYLLGSYLLSNPDYFDIQLANHWACRHEKHSDILKDIWDVLRDENLCNRHGSAFWAIKT
jgi:hypothetical protein